MGCFLGHFGTGWSGCGKWYGNGLTIGFGELERGEWSSLDTGKSLNGNVKQDKVVFVRHL